MAISKFKFKKPTRRRTGEISIENMGDVLKSFENAIHVINEEKVISDIRRKVGEPLAKDMRRRLKKKTTKRTGKRLKPDEAIVSKKFSRQIRSQPATFVAWDVFVAPRGKDGRPTDLGSIFEFGTSRIKRRSFFRPAYNAYKFKSQSTLKKIAEKHIQKAWAK